MGQVQVQVKLDAMPGAVYTALTDSGALAAWFAEHADVRLEAGRYDFWGRYTPEAPDREAGQHPVLAAQAGVRLAYAWRLRDRETTVDIRLLPHGDGTMLAVLHSAEGHGPFMQAEYSYEDFWFLALENLRRFLDGRETPVRCDFSRPSRGDITVEVEIDAPAAAVFDALIRPEQLNRWIASEAKVEPVVGGTYDYGWGPGTAATITRLEPNAALAVVAGQGDQQQMMTWTLEESEGRTRLLLVHSGFGPDADTDGLYTGWHNFMNWLKSMVEYGAGWQPPFIRLLDEARPYYAAGVARQQDAIVDFGAAEGE